MNKMKEYLLFTFRLMVSHFFTYFITGMFFFFTGLNSNGYYENHPTDLVLSLHRESDSAFVMAGPLFQLIRAFLFTIALFPIRDVFLERNKGIVYLWLIFLVFAILAPAGEAPGSIEGVIYTKLPVLFHLLYFPELLVQTFLFILLFVEWERGKLEKYITIPVVVLSVLLFLITIIGLVQKV